MEQKECKYHWYYINGEYYRNVNILDVEKGKYHSSFRFLTKSSLPLSDQVKFTALIQEKERETNIHIFIWFNSILCTSNSHFCRNSFFRRFNQLRIEIPIFISSWANVAFLFWANEFELNSLHRAHFDLYTLEIAVPSDEERRNRF